VAGVLPAKFKNAAGTAASTNLFRRWFGGEFLETRIVPERIKHRIEPEQRGSERDVRSQWASVGY
jgi:hypothetical protein